MTRPTLNALSIVSLVIAAVTGCAPVDGEDGPEDIASEPITCAPRLDRFPVRGPHNLGFDGHATTYYCTATLLTPANSDYYTRNGGGNHTSGHLGNDIFAARGTPVVAARAGTVVQAGPTGRAGGTTVTVRDPCGWFQYYAHLNGVAFGIAPGRVVTAGTTLGFVGNTGDAAGTSTHLHFSLYPDGSYNRGVDPFPHLRSVQPNACDGGSGSTTPPPPPPGASCGGRGERCCASDACDRGLNCTRAFLGIPICQCGMNGLLCCGGTSCDAGLRCSTAFLGIPICVR